MGDEALARAHIGAVRRQFVVVLSSLRQLRGGVPLCKRAQYRLRIEAAVLRRPARQPCSCEPQCKPKQYHRRLYCTADRQPGLTRGGLTRGERHRRFPPGSLLSEPPAERYDEWPVFFLTGWIWGHRLPLDVALARAWRRKKKWEHKAIPDREHNASTTGAKQEHSGSTPGEQREHTGSTKRYQIGSTTRAPRENNGSTAGAQREHSGSKTGAQRDTSPETQREHNGSKTGA